MVGEIRIFEGACLRSFSPLLDLSFDFVHRLFHFRAFVVRIADLGHVTSSCILASAEVQGTRWKIRQFNRFFPFPFPSCMSMDFCFIIYVFLFVSLLQMLGDEIGKGAYGRVYKGLDLENGDFVAIKQVSLENIPQEDLNTIMVFVCFPSYIYLY